MNRPVIVEAAIVPVGKCGVCNYAGRQLPYHDIELGWICKECVIPTGVADKYLNRIAGIRRPPPIELAGA